MAGIEKDKGPARDSGRRKSHRAARDLTFQIFLACNRTDRGRLGMGICGTNMKKYVLSAAGEGDSGKLR
jgi:hypothetical protein